MVNEQYKIDVTKEYPFTTRDFADRKGKHMPITSIPDYIKVRKLVRK